MLFVGGTRQDNLGEPGLRWWHDHRFTIGWKGHVYLPGQRAGDESIAALGSALVSSSLASAAPTLCGVFGLFVHDRVAGTWQITVDNAAMYKLFYDDARVSTSFLELLRARRTRGSDVSTERLIEFLSHGAVYGPFTLVDGVRKLRAEEVLELTADGEMRFHAKRLTDAGEHADIVLDRHFAELAHSVGSRQLSVDVTGGFDTRLIACLLHHKGATFEAAISGREDAEDVIIAHRVADVLGAPFQLSLHDISELEHDLPRTFAAGDGLTDLRRLHRDWQNARARIARGMEVMSHGGGGAHFKDFFCLQDIPRYGSRNTNFARFYDLRVTPVKLAPGILTAQAASILANLRQKTLDSFESYRKPTNNESYDEVAYKLRAPEFYGQYFSNYINLGMDVVAPFLDHTCARAAMRLSAWQRFFSAYHRRLITKYCSQLAVLPTTEGYNASAAAKDLPGNLVGYVHMQARRVAKKASQRLLGKVLFLQMGAATVDVKGFVDILRQTSAFATAMLRLKEVGILAPALSAAEVTDIHVGRILTAGMLLDHLGRRS